jgi:small subunit ribosomal protein S8e
VRKSVENLATSKITGGRNEPINGAQVTVTRRIRGNNKKTALKSIDFVNLATGEAKVKKSKIIKVLENTTNNDYKRRGIITKGAILETAEGKCKVVSKPGQNGIVNAVLLKE